jgi:putative spermidine/putrescine transport system ATP-binding protein
MVRPEKLTVRRPGSADNSSANTLRGTVRDTVFMGEMIRYVIELPNGARMTAKQQHRADTPILSPSEPATIDWAVADTRLV